VQGTFLAVVSSIDRSPCLVFDICRIVSMSYFTSGRIATTCGLTCREEGCFVEYVP
jgi:hypothetical protein